MTKPRSWSHWFFDARKRRDEQGYSLDDIQLRLHKVEMDAFSDWIGIDRIGEEKPSVWQRLLDKLP